MDEVEITAPEPEDEGLMGEVPPAQEAVSVEETAFVEQDAAVGAPPACEPPSAEPVDVPAGEVAPVEPANPVEIDYAALKPVVEAIVYLAEEPVTAAQVAAVIEHPVEVAERLLAELIAEYAAPARGLMIREVAGGYKMGTKPEHHDAIRKFVKSLKPPLKLSLAALETLATIAYKQPITAPEIMAIRGVQGAGVLKTLLDRKLIVAAGRKNVVGRPVLYKTSKEFLVQFGLKDLSELPTLKEFEELRRLSAADEEPAGEGAPASSASSPRLESAQAAESGVESKLAAGGGQADALPESLEIAAPNGAEAAAPEIAPAAEPEPPKADTQEGGPRNGPVPEPESENA
jgi:segregation and condensation protein B